MEEVELTPGELRRAILVMRICLAGLENVFLQVGEGLADETALNSYGWGGGPVLPRPASPAVSRSRHPITDPSSS